MFERVYKGKLLKDADIAEAKRRPTLKDFAERFEEEDDYEQDPFESLKREWDAYDDDENGLNDWYSKSNHKIIGIIGEY